MKPSINHADLLRLSKALGQPVGVELAELLGFELKQEIDSQQEIIPIEGKQAIPQQPAVTENKKEIDLKKQQNIKFNYAYLAVNEPLENSISPILIPHRQQKTRKPRPDVASLIQVSEAQSRLQQCLQINHTTTVLDTEKAVKIIAKNQVLASPPFKQNPRLPDTLYLLLDFSARLEPAFPELHQYLQAAYQLFGRSRLYYCPINYSPTANGDLIFSDGSCLIDKLQDNAAVLYIGDQGAFLSRAKQHHYQWQSFWDKLKHARIQTASILLASPAHADPERVKQLMAATMRCEGPQPDRIRHMRLALQASVVASTKKCSTEKALAEELRVWNHPDHTHSGQIADVEINLLQKWAKAYQQIAKPQRQALEEQQFSI